MVIRFWIKCIRERGFLTRLSSRYVCHLHYLLTACYVFCHLLHIQHQCFRLRLLSIRYLLTVYYAFCVFGNTASEWDSKHFQCGWLICCHLAWGQTLTISLNNLVGYSTFSTLLEIFFCLTCSACWWDNVTDSHFSCQLTQPSRLSWRWNIVDFMC